MGSTDTGIYLSLGSTDTGIYLLSALLTWVSTFTGTDGGQDTCRPCETEWHGNRLKRGSIDTGVYWRGDSVTRGSTDKAGDWEIWDTPIQRCSDMGYTDTGIYWRGAPNSARIDYATEGALFISTQLFTDAVSALRKVWVLVTLRKQHSAQART